MPCGRLISPDNNRSAVGFTLIELVIIIIILGIVAAVAIPKYSGLSEQAKKNATLEEMRRIKTAIIGDPQVIAGGEYIDRGFEGDIGWPPSSLRDLVEKPDSIAPYNKFTRLGWNGPYLDSTEQNYLYDAWGNIYNYDPASRTLESTSPTPPLSVTF